MLYGCSETGENSSSIKLSFDTVFTLNDVLVLPESIFGDFSHIERADNGDFLIVDQSNQRIWLYLMSSDTWRELILEDCHPGIQTYIIGAAFSDDHIHLINAPSLSGHNFYRDGSCGNRMVEDLKVPDFISGFRDGFVGIVSPPGEEIPNIIRFDHEGNIHWNTKFKEHPNPAFSYRIQGGGAIVNNDLVYIVSSSTPEIYIFNLHTGDFQNKISPVFVDIFDSVNDGFDERRFKQDPWNWLSNIGSHMIVAGVGLFAEEYLIFATPTMQPDSNYSDYYLIYQLSENGQFHVQTPDDRRWTPFLSGGFLHEIFLQNEQMEIHIYSLNINGFPEGE